MDDWVTDRTKALARAIRFATDTKRIVQIYCYADNRWFIDGYHPTLIPTAKPETLRYVLPNGEVTKLS